MTGNDAATKTEGVADRYIAVWNEPDDDARRRAVAELWTEDGTYTDPLASVQGHQAIEEVIVGAREQFPGYVFKLIDNVDAHHDVARFGREREPRSPCWCQSGCSFSPTRWRSGSSRPVPA